MNIFWKNQRKQSKITEVIVFSSKFLWFCWILFKNRPQANTNFFAYKWSFKKKKLAFKRKNTPAFTDCLHNVYTIKMRELWAVFWTHQLSRIVSIRCHLSWVYGFFTLESWFFLEFRYLNIFYNDLIVLKLRFNKPSLFTQITLFLTITLPN